MKYKLSPKGQGFFYVRNKVCQQVYTWRGRNLALRFSGSIPVQIHNPLLIRQCGFFIAKNHCRDDSEDEIMSSGYISPKGVSDVAGEILRILVTDDAINVANQSPAGLVGSGVNEKISVTQNVKKTIVTADAIVTASPAIVYGIFVNTAGTSISLYDHATAASGEALDFVTTTVGSQAMPVGIEFDTGIYADITGASEIVVLWRPLA